MAGAHLPARGAQADLFGFYGPEGVEHDEAKFRNDIKASRLARILRRGAQPILATSSTATHLRSASPNWNVSASSQATRERGWHLRSRPVDRQGGARRFWTGWCARRRFRPSQPLP